MEKFPFHLKSCQSLTGQDKLKRYLKSQGCLLNMCSLPIHAAMICFIFQHEEGNIPVTQTKLYEQFTRLTTLRHLRCKHKNIHLNSLQQLEGKDKKCFQSLCHLAFNMTISSKQVDRHRKHWVPAALDTVYDDVSSLGLVAVDYIAELAGFKKNIFILSSHHLL